MKSITKMLVMVGIVGLAGSGLEAATGKLQNGLACSNCYITVKWERWAGKWQCKSLAPGENYLFDNSIGGKQLVLHVLDQYEGKSRGTIQFDKCSTLTFERAHSYKAQVHYYGPEATTYGALKKAYELTQGSGTMSQTIKFTSPTSCANTWCVN